MTDHCSIGLLKFARSLVLVAGLGALCALAVAQEAAENPNQAVFNAVKRADSEALKRALDAGTDPNLRDEQGRGLLHLAVLNSRRRIVQQLLDAGAKVDLTNAQGQQPVHAVGDDVILQSLVAHGANVRAKDAKGWEPIHYAAQAGTGTRVADLLAAGADASATTPEGLRPMHLAAAQDNARALFEFLVAGASVAVLDNQGLQPIHHAARRAGGGFQGIAMLQAAGADPEAKTPAGLSAFDLARQGGNARLAEVMASHMRSVKAMPSRQAALFKQVLEDYALGAPMLRLALANGFGVDTPFSADLRVLDYAIWEYKSTAIGILLEAGASLEPSGRFSAPLCTALRAGYPELAEQILKRRADTTNCGDGTSPMGATMHSKKQAEGMALLLKYRVPVDPPGMNGVLHSLDLDKVLDRDPLATAKRLIDAGADVNAVERRAGWTPLFRAVSDNNPELVRLLLAHGANPDARDFSGKRPLDYAVTLGKLAAAQALEAGTSGEQQAAIRLARERASRRQEILEARISIIAPERLGYACDAILARFPQRIAAAAGPQLEATAREFEKCVANFQANPPQLTAAQLRPVYPLLSPAERVEAESRVQESRKQVDSSIEYGKKEVQNVLRLLQTARTNQREADAQWERDNKVYPAESSSAFLKGLSNQLQGVNNQMRNEHIKPKVDSTEFYARIAEQDEKQGSEANQQRRREEQRAAERRAQEERQRREREAQREQDRASQEQADKTRVAAEQAEAARKRSAEQKAEADAKAAQEARERERQLALAEARAKAEKQAADDKRRRDEAQAKAEREAKALSDKLAKDSYLRTVARGMRLRATTCMDGEGKHYMVGIRPSVKPELVSCIDVRFRAVCEGSQQGSQGLARNFLGASTDCWMGDTVEINPKPACKASEVKVEVVSVSECS